MRFILAAAAAAAAATATLAAGEPVLMERFSSLDAWKHSSDEKYTGAFELADGALTVPEPAKHYGLATKVAPALDPSTSGLAFQYELKLGSDGITCGGAYMKLVTDDAAFTPEGLVDTTPYSIMFGPDKCGSTNKVHLILRHKSPKTGEVEEKHLDSPPLVETDGLTHVYTLLLHPANSSYDVLVDGVSKKAGSLFEDFTPAINPPKEIDDPKDTKPADWVEAARIPDPAAKKPADWDEDAPRMVDDADAEKPEGWLDDEPSEVDDPDAKQPADWDEEEDGTWEAPKVANPACADAPGCGPWTRPKKINPDYKGKWTAPMIDNPAYKGPWAPRKIANPDYVEDTAPLSNIGAVGGLAVEIWTMDKGYAFSNVLLSADPADAAAARAEHWAPKHEVEAAEAAKKEAEDKVKAEAEAKKAASAAAGGASLADRLLALFDSDGPLASLRDPAEPLLDAVADNEWLAWVVVALPALLAAAPVALLARGRKAGAAPKKAAAAAASKKAGKAPAAAAAAAKKKDDDADADAAAAESEEEEAEGEADKAAPAAAPAATSEQTMTKDDAGE